MTTRNSNAHFELAPQVEIERSTFDRSCNIHTSFNVGELIPFYVDEILPGDTFQIETSKVARLQTLIAPVMDNLYLDTYYFFVPNRLVWDHWKEFCGENNDYDNPWIDPVEYSVPQCIMPYDGWKKGTIADYMGIPTMVTSDSDSQIKVNALPFRAYCQIYNDWFRDENIVTPLYISHGDADVMGSNSLNWQSCERGGYPYYACKYHDYFTSCLPAPQKGADVNFINGMIPVKTFALDTVTGAGLPPLRIKHTDNSRVTNGKALYAIPTGSSSVVNNLSDAGTDAAPSGTVKQIVPTNLYGSLSDLKDFVGGQLVTSSDLTINSLRQAFQIQRMLEKDARGGTRYIEILQAHFSVKSPDARLQRAEYLGGNRVPLNIEQVVNTTGNEGMELFPGDCSGWSQTNDTSYDVEKSFVEHGYIIGLMCARYDHTYQQGLDRMWTRRSRYDFYWPALAHLGEQPVYEQEIFLKNYNFDHPLSTDTFGYQEAWAEYRYKPNYVTGAMRSNANNSLDIWHFADEYDTEPTLQLNWIVEQPDNVDRCLTVHHNLEDQIFIDIFVKNKCTRPMPLYSIPGYIDHF